MRRERSQFQFSPAEYGDGGTEAVTSRSALRPMFYTGKCSFWRFRPSKLGTSLIGRPGTIKVAERDPLGTPETPWTRHGRPRGPREFTGERNRGQ